MNPRELIIAIEQILIPCTVAHDSGRELFSAVHGVVSREGDSSVLEILFNIVDVVNGDYACEVGDKSRDEGLILIRIILLLTAVRKLLSRCYGVKSVNGISFFSIVVVKFVDVDLYFLAVAAGLSGEVDYFRSGIFIYFSRICEHLEIIRVCHIIKIAVFFPFS